LYFTRNRCIPVKKKKKHYPAQAKSKSNQMKNYIVLFREPDGRTAPHEQQDIDRHRDNWKR